MHGLLPDPFPVPASTKRRAAVEAVGGVLARIPAVAKAATRKAGSSMVVVTDVRVRRGRVARARPATART